MENKELERIQEELLAEDEVMKELLAQEEPVEEEEKDISLDEFFNDEELIELLRVEAEPAFEDPVKIREPKEPMVYQNFANDYGAKEREAAALIREKDQKTIMTLMILASALCLGIIGILGYWMSFLP